MNHPSSRHLTHDYAAYKGLSLRELFWLVLSASVIDSLGLTLVGAYFGFPLAFFCLGFFLGFIAGITVCPKQLARLKAGKPAGFLLKKIWIFLAHWGIKHTPYCHYQGLWQKSKKVDAHV